MPIAGGRTVVGSIKRRWRREVQEFAMDAVRLGVQSENTADGVRIPTESPRPEIMCQDDDVRLPCPVLIGEKGTA